MPVRPPTFRPAGHRSRRQANAEYDARRGTSVERGYDAAWRKAAASFRISHPRCLGCQAVGKIAATVVVDHIIPHKGDRGLMWDRRNWQPSCRFHHDVVKQRLEILFAQGRINTAELHLDSPGAVEITLRSSEVGGP